MFHKTEIVELQTAISHNWGLTRGKPLLIAFATVQGFIEGVKTKSTQHMLARDLIPAELEPRDERSATPSSLVYTTSMYV